MADMNPKSKEFWMALTALVGTLLNGIINIIFG